MNILNELSYRDRFSFIKFHKKQTANPPKRVLTFLVFLLRDRTLEGLGKKRIKTVRERNHFGIYTIVIIFSQLLGFLYSCQFPRYIVVFFSIVCFIIHFMFELRPWGASTADHIKKESWFVGMKFFIYSTYFDPKLVCSKCIPDSPQYNSRNISIYVEPRFY